MAELKNYRGKDFSVTVNSKMRGIEIRFASKIGDDEIAEMKNAGFRWSRRQQMWYAYQNENTIAFADSLVQDFEARYKQIEKNSERTFTIRDKDHLERISNATDTPIAVLETGIQLPEEVAQKAEKQNEREQIETSVVSPQDVKDLFIGGRHTQSQARRIREEAKKILAEHTDEQIAGNPEMLELLAQYEGGGGISGESDRTPSEVLNAFYTPREVVNAVWQLAEHYAPNAKTVLDPSSGIGRFAENRDGDKEFTLREIDGTSARIAKILHPNANVIQGAFQEQFFDESGRVVKKDYEMPKYDIVIGNPPYGENKSVWAGRGEGKQFARIEEYFVSRGMDSLKDENSVLLFVMPSSFLKSFPDSAKRLVAEKCALVDAYRLPNGAFDTTDVGTDIIVLKKGACSAEEISSDNFFKKHPEKILGEEYTDTDRFGKEVTKVRPRGANTLKDELDGIGEILGTEYAAQKKDRYAEIRPYAKTIENYLRKNFQETENAPGHFEYTVETPKNQLGENSISRIENGLDPETTLSVVLDTYHEDEVDDRFSQFAEEAINAVYDEHKVSLDLEQVEDYLMDSEKMNVVYDAQEFLKRQSPEIKMRLADAGIKAETMGITEDELQKIRENSNTFTIHDKEYLERISNAVGQDVSAQTELIGRAESDALEFYEGSIAQEKGHSFKAYAASQLAVKFIENEFSLERYGEGGVKLDEIGLDVATGIITNHFQLKEKIQWAVNELKEQTETLEEKKNASARPNLDEESSARLKDNLEWLVNVHGCDEEKTRVVLERLYTMESKFSTVREAFERSKAIPLAFGKEHKDAEWVDGKELEETIGIFDEQLDYHTVWDRNWAARQGMSRADVSRLIKWDYSAPNRFIEKKSNELFPKNEWKIPKHIFADDIVDANEYIAKNELENFIREKVTETLSVKNFEVKWNGNTLSFRYDTETEIHPVCEISADDAEKILSALIEAAENFDVGEYGERNGHADAAEEIEAALGACVPELKSLRKYVCIQKGIEPLSQDEAALVEKIAEETKMDVWLEIDGDGFAFDLENNAYIDAAELLGDFREGFEADEHNFESLSEDEKKIWNAMVERLSKGAGERKPKTEISETLAPSAPQKDAVDAKQKGETLTAREFAKFYGKEFSESGFKIWRATDWEGRIDLSKLDEDGKRGLLENTAYAEIEPDVWTHREFFVSGDIGKKIQEYEKKSAELGEDDSRRTEIYKKNIDILKGILPEAIPLERLHFGANTTLAKEFKITHAGENGEGIEMNLQESFILWAQGETYQSMTANDSYYRSSIDFATANISLEDFPENVSWRDIVEYIDKKLVKAIPIRKGYKMTDEDVAVERAQRKREAEEKRMARAETADRLFDKFLHEGLSESDRRNVEAEYNKRFNSYRIPDYSKLPLFVDGMSAFKGDDRFKLYDQQIKGISFLSNKGNGLLAYDVGVGKTAAGIVANVNQIQLGRSRRPLIVVPNSVYTKWYNDIKELFPNVQVNDLYNFNKESVAKFRDINNPHKLNIPANSISLCTYEALTHNITFTDESCENALYEDFSKLLSEELDGNDTENARNAEKIKNAIGAASQVKNSNFVFFEECGFDNITVDEAHNFKNLWTVPRPKNKGESNEFAGIPSGKPSQRALKLYAMTQLVQRENDSRNVFLLTATPFTNSPLEVYSMLSYVGRQRLIDSGIHSLRDFLNQFAHTKLEIAVNAQGSIDYKQVMKDWKELPALQNILTEYIDKVDGEEANIIRPRKFTHVKDLDLTSTQKQMIEADTEHMLEVKEGNSAAVIVSMNAMRLALVAPALADRSRYSDIEIPPMEKLVETSPKLKFVCDSIIDMHRKNPEKGQFMYMPLGQQAHGIVKGYLVEHGIPKDAVEVINGSTNNSVEKKERLTERFNDEKDKLKIIIGGKNTSEGIDLNGNSFVMYNCSLGWNPSEITQAEGRVWRQGNLQGHVHCVYPVMNDSIDSVLYQKHDEKQSRIGDLWSYKGENLNVEDIRPEDLKFDLIKDPVKRAKLMLDEATKELKAELSKTELRIKSYDGIVEKRVELEERLEEANETLEYRENLRKQYSETGDLKIPSWLKSEIADAKKERRSASLKMEAVNEKLEKLGIHSEEESANYMRKLNVMKHEIEKQIEMKESELPAIVGRLRAELDKRKITFPPLEEQRKELCDEILSNLRPMKEIAGEIKTERFEKMLEKKFQSGEITEEQHALYKRAGYDDYEKWICGEIENLEKFLNERQGKENSSGEVFNTTESKIYDAQKEILTGSSKEEIQDSKANPAEAMSKKKAVSDKGTQMSLFSEEELDALSQKKPAALKKKNFLLVAYTSDSGFSERGEFETRQAASDAGMKFMRDWNLSKDENGFVVYDTEERVIGGVMGTFNPREYFSEEILALNEMFRTKDFADSIKETKKERTNAHDECPKMPLIVGGLSKPKKRASVER